MVLDDGEATKLKEIFKRGIENFRRFLAQKQEVPAGRPK
jgi:hypothetical protein